MLLATLVSSMKTRRLGSSFGCLLRKALRSAATSGRSCSAACRLFFKGQLQMAQKSEDRRLADPDLLLRQYGFKLRQRDIRLLCQQVPDKFLMCCQRIRLVPAEFCRADASLFALASEKPPDRTQAHMMSLGSFLPRRPLLDRLDHAGAQIIRIRLRHSCWPPPQREA